MKKWKGIIELFRELRTEIKYADRKVFEMFCCSFAGVGLFMCLINILSHSYFMAAITGGIGLWMAGMRFVFRSGEHIKIGIWGIAVLMMAVMLHLLIDGGEEGFSFVWLLLVPPVGMYFLPCIMADYLVCCLGFWLRYICGRLCVK